MYLSAVAVNGLECNGVNSSVAVIVDPLKKLMDRDHILVFIGFAVLRIRMVHHSPQGQGLVKLAAFPQCQLQLTVHHGSGLPGRVGDQVSGILFYLPAGVQDLSRYVSPR